jgi:C_GCAxxG_C_C family probable redox protein
MEENTEKKAIESFRAGLNCSQAVFSAYSEKLGFDEKLALSVACGFGGGMGRLQETCGAVTGAYMAIGVYACKKYTDNKDRKEMSYAMIQEFSRKFKEIHSTTDCIDLLGVDLKTQEGNRMAREKNLFGTTCEKCISDSVRIVNDITSQ